MANIKSAIKRARQAQSRTLRNRMVKSQIRTATRRFLEAVETGNAEAADERLNQTVALIDKAAKKGVLHPNAAARRKSRLMNRLNGAKASAE